MSDHSPASTLSIAKPELALISGRLLARNTIWNLAGQVLPMAVALIAVPLLIRGIGAARFGVLSIAWVLIGYFSLFDLGIGRALTKLVAEKAAAREDSTMPALAWTSLFLLLLLGFFLGGTTCAIAPWLVHNALKIPAALQKETLQGFYLLAASIPMVTTTSGLRGVLEARQRFRILNLIRIPMSVFSFVAPLPVLPFSQSLVPVISILVLGRLIGCVAHVVACFHAVPSLRSRIVLDSTLIAPVFRIGGWMTLANLLGPALIYMDRLVIGMVLSVTAVGYYTAPVDMLTRLWAIPTALAAVLFPAFAASLAQQPARAEFLLARGVKYIFLSMFPIILVVIGAAPEVLRAWLGTIFAQNGAGVMRWIAAGIFLNSLGQVPLNLIQSGRPDVVGKLLLAESAVYPVVLWAMTRQIGIEGAAIAWAGRFALEGCFVFLYSVRLLSNRPAFLLKLLSAAAASLIVFYLITVPESFAIRASLLLLGLAVFGFVSWVWGLKASERVLLLQAARQSAAKSPTA